MEQSVATMVAGVSSLLLSAFVFFHAAGMKDFGVTYLSPGTTPSFLSFVIFACGISLSLEGLRGLKKRNPGKPLIVLPRWSDVGIQKMAIIFAMTVVYVMTVPHLHFTITSILFLAVTFYLLRVGSLWKIAALTFISVFAVQYTFVGVFKTLLP